MKKYLLEICEGVGTRFEANVKVLVAATDPGYAKYHWHRKQNRMGMRKDPHSKDSYQNHNIGYWTELESVREVTDEELPILEDVLDEIPGFNPE